jgi:hypothetical protein
MPPQRQLPEREEQREGQAQVKPEQPGGQACEEVMAAEGQLAVGSIVKLQDLKVAHRLNGCAGICEQWDNAQGRWLVLLPETGEAMLVKPEHLAVEVGNPASPEGSAATSKVASFALLLAKLVN